MKQTSLEVEILGLKQRLEGEPSSINYAVQRVQREIDQVMRKSPEISTLKAVIAVALGLADEVYSLQESLKREKIKKEMGLERINDAIKKIDQLK